MCDDIRQIFIDKMDSNDEYKEIKKQDIKLIVYNNKHIVTNEEYQDLEIII